MNKNNNVSTFNVIAISKARTQALYQSNGDTLRSRGQLQDQLLMVETRVTIN